MEMARFEGRPIRFAPACGILYVGDGTWGSRFSMIQGPLHIGCLRSRPGRRRSGGNGLVALPVLTMRRVRSCESSRPDDEAVPANRRRSRMLGEVEHPAVRFSPISSCPLSGRVDDVAVVGVGRARVVLDLLAADVSGRWLRGCGGQLRAVQPTSRCISASGEATGSVRDPSCRCRRR